MPEPTYDHIGENRHPFFKSHRRTVPAGEAVILRLEEVVGRKREAAPWAIAVAPDADGTVKVEVSISPPDLNPADCLWHVLANNVAASTLLNYPSPVSAIRVTATGHDATVEVLA